MQPRLLGSARLALPLAHFREVAVEEVVEERADHGDRGDPPDRLPVGGDRRLDDVGGELEGQPGDQPARIAQPDVAPLVARRRRKQRRKRCR